MVGALCGATTNTPALGAAQQTLKQMGLESNSPALSCAVTYPLGVIGVILAILLIRKLMVRPSDLIKKEEEDPEHTYYIVAFQVENPAIFNRTVKEIAHFAHQKFVISRLWREGEVSIPTSERVIREDDRVLVVTTEKEVDSLTVLFGKQEKTDWNKKDIDWSTIDSQLISQDILITRPEINGKKLSALRLRNHYGINISHVYRAGVKLLATPDLTLQMGDRLNIVGEIAAIRNVENVLGNVVNKLKEPNLVAVFVGLLLGLALGTIPLNFPGVSLPVRLGVAGGPIIVGILIGTFGPRLHMVTYTTRSANLMLRSLGLSLYLACLGLDAGSSFFETVFRPEGLLWIGTGFGLTIIPVLLIGIIAFKMMRIDFGSVSGMLCGSMANPMALDYVNDTIPGDSPSVSYATVYPFCMFLRVIITQILIMFFV
jgi:AspT/YidE/YbjL antiporter-like protein